MVRSGRCSNAGLGASGKSHHYRNRVRGGVNSTTPHALLAESQPTRAIVRDRGVAQPAADNYSDLPQTKTTGICISVENLALISTDNCRYDVCGGGFSVKHNHAAIFFEPTYRNLVHRPNGWPWWHSMPLPNGDRIAGAHQDPNVQLKLWQTLDLDRDENLHGRRVIDIGANDGYFTIGTILAGAERVTAINTADRRSYPHNLHFAAEQWKVSPEVLVGDFLTHSFVDGYDLILCLGVLYHLENVFLAMRRLRRLLNRDGALYLETQMSQIESALPLYESASDIYPTIAPQNKERVDAIGISNFLFPNEAAILNLAYLYDLLCERLEGPYTTDYKSRAVFKMRSA
jgi:2-polyprenyl-3-methyl-5-hydroxy-6-metoxy-1,4-benzoquinol methylase